MNQTIEMGSSRIGEASKYAKSMGIVVNNPELSLNNDLLFYSQEKLPIEMLSEESVKKIDQLMVELKSTTDFFSSVLLNTMGSDVLATAEMVNSFGEIDVKTYEENAKKARENRQVSFSLFDVSVVLAQLISWKNLVSEKFVEIYNQSITKLESVYASVLLTILTELENAEKQQIANQGNIDQKSEDSNQLKPRLIGRDAQVPMDIADASLNTENKYVTKKLEKIRNAKELIKQAASKNSFSVQAIGTHEIFQGIGA